MLPNWTPNANPIESWHNQLGSLVGVIERASFTNLLEVNVPAICKDASLNLAMRGWTFQPTYAPYDMLVVARDRLRRSCPLMSNSDKTVFKVMSRRYWAKHPEAEGEIMRPLWRKYKASLEGDFPEGVTKAEAQSIATCMHTVVVDERYKGVPVRPFDGCP